jgi:hypothetical protein
VWLLQEVKETSDVLRLPLLGVMLEVGAIYRRVEWDTPSETSDA